MTIDTFDKYREVLVEAKESAEELMRDIIEAGYLERYEGIKGMLDDLEGFEKSFDKTTKNLLMKHEVLLNSQQLLGHNPEVYSVMGRLRYAKEEFTRSFQVAEESIQRTINAANMQDVVYRPEEITEAELSLEVFRMNLKKNRISSELRGFKKIHLKDYDFGRERTYVLFAVDVDNNVHEIINTGMSSVTARHYGGIGGFLKYVEERKTSVMKKVLTNRIVKLGVATSGMMTFGHKERCAKFAPLVWVTRDKEIIEAYKMLNAI